MRTVRRLHPGLWLMLLAAGCGLYQTRTDKLREAIINFNDGVRWGRLEDVLSRIDPKTEAHFLEMHKDFGRTIQVTDSEVVNTDVNLDKGVAFVGIKMTWYRIDEMVVRETTLLQRWEDRKGTWIMVSEEYRAGAPF